MLMTDVLYVPKLASNLFSVHAAAKKRKVLSFGCESCWIRSGSGQQVGLGSAVGKLYKLDCEVQKPSVERATIADSSKIDLWHQRLAHVNHNQLRQLKSAEGVDVQQEEKQSFCEACVQGKMHQLPHKPLKEIKSKEKLQLVHTDVCGPMQTQSFGGNRYFITFTDDYSRSCKVYFLKKKSEAFEKFKEFKAAAEKESGQKVKALQADRDGKYLSKEFKCYLRAWYPFRVHCGLLTTTQWCCRANESHLSGSRMFHAVTCLSEQRVLGRRSCYCGLSAKSNGDHSVEI